MCRCRAFYECVCVFSPKMWGLLRPKYSPQKTKAKIPDGKKKKHSLKARLRSPPAVGRGSTTVLLPSDKAPRKAPTPPSSRPSFPVTGSARSKSSPWAPLRPPTPRTAVLSTTNSSTSTSLLTCRGATPNAASPSFEASPTGTLTTPMTYQSTFRPTPPPTSLTPLRPNPHLTTSPSTTSHRRLNASRSNRFRGSNSFTAMVASLPYSTKLVGLGSSAPLGNARWTYETSDPTFFGTGRAHTPTQHRQTNRLYRKMRIGAVRRELSRSRGEIFLAPGYGLVPRTPWLQHFRSSPLPSGAHIWYKTRNGLW